MEEYNLVLTETQLKVVDKALQALPLGEAYNVYTAIKAQLEAQPKKDKDCYTSAG